MKNHELLFIIGLIFIFFMDETLAGVLLITFSSFIFCKGKEKGSSLDDSTNVGKKSE
jgi:hypothetical protein